ncbi:MAG: hypothetical protein JOZ19_13525 [Rubrobacter sp.]|nr:hypothetical protein [Rubrobacter sp.]
MGGTASSFYDSVGVPNRGLQQHRLARDGVGNRLDRTSSGTALRDGPSASRPLRRRTLDTGGPDLIGRVGIGVLLEGVKVGDTMVLPDGVGLDLRMKGSLDDPCSNAGHSSS